MTLRWLWHDDSPQDSAIRFATSWAVSSLILGIIRTIIAVYIFAVLFTTIGIEVANNAASAAGFQFAYFTSLGYWALAFYFTFAAVHSFAHHRSGSPLLQRWPYPFLYAHAALYASITTFSIVVSLVFWTVLRQGAFFDRFAIWNNASEHGLNSFFALCEIIIPRTKPSAWNKLVPLAVALALYLAETAIFRAANGYYVYPFLDPANGRGIVAGAVVGILVGMIIVFVVVRYLIVLRKWLVEVKLSFSEPAVRRRHRQVRHRHVSDGHPSHIELVQHDPKT